MSTRAPRLSAAERRDQLLGVAWELFQRDGYEQTSMEGIARAAGVSKPVVYGAFPTKGDILLALTEREEQRMLREIVQRLPEHPGEDPARTATLAIGAFLDAVAREPELYRLVLLAEGGLGRGVAARIQEGRTAIVELVAQVVGVWFVEQDRDPEDPAVRVVAHSLVGLAEGAARAQLTEPDRFDPASTTQVLETIIRAAEHAISEAEPAPPAAVDEIAERMATRIRPILQELIGDDLALAGRVLDRLR